MIAYTCGGVQECICGACTVGKVVFAPLPKAGEPRVVDMQEEFRKRILEWRPISRDDLPFEYPTTLVAPKPRIRVKAGSRKLA